MEKYRFLDLGGGPEWFQGWGETPWLKERMNNLRAVKLARNNPQGGYLVFDPGIPGEMASRLQEQLPNLHFIVGEVCTKPDNKKNLPFPDCIFDTVEMNFVYSPLTYSDLYKKNHHVDFKYMSSTYLYTLFEASRVLKTGGRLSLCEKKENMLEIRRRLSKDSYLDLDGPFLSICKIEPVDYPHFSEVIDRKRTYYTQSAYQQMADANESDDGGRVDDLEPVILDFIKRD